VHSHAEALAQNAVDGEAEASRAISALVVTKTLVVVVLDETDFWKKHLRECAQ
jgi:hypothetical protein